MLAMAFYFITKNKIVGEPKKISKASILYNEFVT